MPRTLCRRQDNRNRLPALRLDSIQLPCLPAQMQQQRLRRQRPACCALDQLRAAVTFAVGVDVPPEPAEQGLELAGCELGVEVPELAAGGFEELGGVEVAERVGGEVAERTPAPVD